ncbi:MAG TPA: SUMF1/EgtB/PvdO family nonheme iron enzyme [Dehalococcoidia bacterium]|nr:SUMF1/EgtB/PvdO family nonheme iron enzyme [Dehalococcoidia bacterium]
MLLSSQVDAATVIPDLMPIPGGVFTMGKADGRPDEQPAHQVRLAPFQAAISPVTNAQYASYLRATGVEPPRFWHDPRFNHSDCPVVGVSWFEAVSYCQWLTTLTGVCFRLPTEAEREFAALGGQAQADWPWDALPGARHPLADELATLEQPHVPGEACANGYGLRCMAENVHEWCQDWYSPDYYAVSPVDNPRGPETGARRVSRGGSWRHSIKFTRITARASLPPDYRYNDFGFRVYADS